jgi:hypothetical protein
MGRLGNVRDTPLMGRTHMSTPIEIENKRSRRSAQPEPSVLYQRIQEQIEEHPYRTLAVAAGLGFMLGGGVLGRVTGKLVATGLRLGLAAVVTPMATQIMDELRGRRTNNH